MPLVNVIRGDRVPDAPLTVRTPVVRVPLWMVISWWVLKAVARAVWFTGRYWYATVPAAGLLWLYARYGWLGPVAAVALVAAVCTGWALVHRSSFERWVRLPVWSRWRAVGYRRRWLPAMSTVKLTPVYDGQAVAPVLRRVRTNGWVDVLTVRMVTGQIPDDFAKAGERLAHTFGAIGFRVAPGARPDLVNITLRRRDALAAVIGPLPVPAVPDFTALPLGLTEDRDVYRLRLFDTQVLVVGATGAGKGSVIWSAVRSVAAGISSGLVQVWGLDPKGGMELGGGERLFARFAYKDFDQMADFLEEALAVAQERTERLRRWTRQHIPTVDDPLYLIVIDELAALTAYVTDRKLKDRIKAALGLLLTQGRAVGVHVLAALQDPRKEVLPFRNLFPTRIGLRMSEPAEVDLTFGDGARDRGALCDRIPESTPGVGYVVIDGDPTPMRVRFSYLDDADIHDLSNDYARLRLIPGDDKDGAA